MNGRVVGILLAAVLGIVAVGLGGFFAFKKLFARPPHDVVITYRRHASPLDNDDHLASPTARTLAMKSPRLLRTRSVATQDRVTVECSFDSKPAQYDDDKKTVENTTEQVLHALNSVQPPPLIEDAEPDTRMWVLAKKDVYAQLDEIRGVTVWHGCGTPSPKRFSIRLDPAKLAGYKVDPSSFVMDVETKAMEPGVQLPTLMDMPVKGYVKLSQVATALNEDPSPPTCTALTANGDSVVALRMKFHPKIAPEDRGKVDAVVKEANGTVLGEKDYTEVRFFPSSDASPEQVVTIAHTVMTEAGLPIIAVTMTDEGSGAALLKREAKDDAIRAYFTKTRAIAWGGIRGRHYVQVTAQDRDRNAVQIQADILVRKMAPVVGLGQRIFTAPPTRLQLTYQIDTARALEDNVDLNALLALVPQNAKRDSSLPVVFESPAGDLKIHGKPISDYVSTRTGVAPQIVRVNGTPAVELRWEVVDPKALKRVRQIVGESPAATLVDVPDSF